jgi:hypothetical protein
MQEHNGQDRSRNPQNWNDEESNLFCGSHVSGTHGMTWVTHYDAPFWMQVVWFSRTARPQSLDSAMVHNQPRLQALFRKAMA